MPKTYTYLPLSISTIFAELVSEVSTNLSDDTSVSVPQVSFKCETWIELIKRLEAEDNSTTHRSTKYPLVALIRNFDEKYTSENQNMEVSLTIVIVTQSTPTKLSEDRDADSYVPVLRPIYAELMEVIKDSTYIDGYYNRYPSHTKSESYQLGTETPQGNSKHLLPDCVDAIIIEDLKLSVIPDKCRNIVVGSAVATVYVNNVSELRLANDSLAFNYFTVELLSAQYIDTLSVGYAASPLYYLLTTHDGQRVELLVGDTVTISSFTAEHTGLYSGYIECDDGVTVSRLTFYYKRLNSKIRLIGNQTKFLLTNFTTSGFEYDNYPFTVVTRHQALPSGVQKQTISTEGNDYLTLYYDPSVQDTTEKSTTIAVPILAGYRVVAATVMAENTIFESISYFKQV